MDTVAELIAEAVRKERVRCAQIAGNGAQKSLHADKSRSSDYDLGAVVTARFIAAEILKGE